MKLSPERQAEYDAMGLPWNQEMSEDWIQESDSTVVCEAYSLQEPKLAFAVSAANAYHKHEQIIKEFKAKLGGYDKRLSEIATEYHYPECWDTDAYPTLFDAIQECACCSVCNPHFTSQPKLAEYERQVKEGELVPIAVVKYYFAGALMDIDESQLQHFAAEKAKESKQCKDVIYER